jgi:RNA polymerase sigma-70 factor, ECF subfamily
MDHTRQRERFEAEAITHLDALLCFALKLTHTRADAEDLVSDTILRALDRWQQYQLGTNMRAWLFTILYRLFVSRRRVRTREVQLVEGENDWSPHRSVEHADTEARFYDTLVDERITRALDDLPGQYRTAVVLSDLHGLGYDQIAKLLGTPTGTVKSRISRGRRTLRQKLAGYAAEMGYIPLTAAA